ncbi:hypothetical protein [Anthocerotibacter panamensis]|nr:hypothetical protein [Anthocerotibacter panamensis]
MVLCLSPLVLAEPLGNTIPCSESQAFKDLKDARINGLKEKIAATDPATQYAKDLTASMELWEYRYANYEKNASCDKDSGQPHLIVDGRLSHAGDFIIPSILFLWLAGALGWAGRDYLLKTQNAMDEILIDFSKAVPSLVLGLAWPLFAIPQILSGAIRDNRVKP